MKKNLLLIPFLVLFVWASDAQDIQVPETQTPLIVKVTASWCPFCGSWGWDFFQDIYSDHKENAAILTVHHSGEHTNDVANDVANNFNIFSQPRFILDGVDLNVSSSNGSTKRTEVNNAVGSTLSLSPQIQTGLDAHYSNGEITVDYVVEAFENLSGEYYVALYLAEKVFIGYQSNVGNNAEHKSLLRDELISGGFGEVLFSNGTSKGQTFEGSSSMSLGNYTPGNLRVVAVIWEKSGSQYEFVNSNFDNEVQEKTTSNIYDSEIAAQVKVFPTIVKEQVNISFLNIYRTKQAVKQIYWTDMSGRKLQNVSTLEVGHNLITINKPDFIGTGLYFLNIEIGSERIVKRIIIE